MQKIKDRFLLGIVTGIVASLPGRVMNKIEFELGLTDSRYEQMAASLFVNKKDSHSVQGKIIGKIANWLLSNAVGVTTTYLLSVTGRDHAAMKGVGVASTAWLGLYGLSSKRMRKSKKPLAALLSFTDHLMFGVTSGLLVSKVGDDSLFPEDKSITEDSELQFTAK